jgi:hypothetical protein
VKRPIVARGLAALVFFAALALLAVGCQPARGPEAFVELGRCDHCMETTCGSESLTCGADTVPALAKSENGGPRCACLLGCRLLRRSVPWCLNHCGPSAAYDSLRSCIDANCDAHCPRNEEP